MCYMTVLSCFCFFFFFFSFYFFLSCFFFLMLFVNVHKISILFSFCPKNFFFFFFLSLKNFSYGYFSTFWTYVPSQHFFLNSINISLTWALSIQFSSYFVIKNLMFFDFLLSFKTCTIVPNFRTYSIYISINLTIVVIFIHNISFFFI